MSPGQPRFCRGGCKTLLPAAPPGRLRASAFCARCRAVKARRIDQGQRSQPPAPSPMARDGGPALFYGRRWRTIAEQVRLRDRGTCRRCGRAWTFEDGRRWPVDHIVPRRLFVRRNGTYDDKAGNRLRNLALLCPGCHGFVTARAERLALQGDTHDQRAYLRSLALTRLDLGTPDTLDS